MRCVLPVEPSNYPKGWHSEVLAGPQTGFDACYVVCSRLEPGAAGPALHQHAADQLYFVLAGEMTLQLGDYVTSAAPGTLVRIPEGTPHCNWNAGAADELHLELIAPAPEWSKVLLPAMARHIPDPESLIKRPTGCESWQSSAHFQYRFLADRSTGSAHIAVNLARLQPGGRGPDFHIHTFDQFYFVLRGTLTIDVGLATMKAPAMSLVALPAGIVHRQRNDGAEAEEHLAILIPAPAAGERLDHPVSI